MEAQPGEPRRDTPGAREMKHASSLRISDDDRHKVAEVLRQAAGEGRIDLEELDERLEATYRAKTYGDLVPITVDLPTMGAQHPVPVPRPSPPVTRGPHYSTSVAVMSETRRVGTWSVDEAHTALAVMGAVVLDLREARFESGEVTINASAVMGEYTELPAKVPFDASLGGPVVRIRGFALMGSVNVQRKAQPGGAMRRLLGRPGL